jgi:dUTP pyrophosphatase
MKIKLSNGAFAPTRANPTDAGLDLKARDAVTLAPDSVTFVDTGVSFDLSGNPMLGEVNYVGLVFQRSGHMKLNVSLANGVGVIDSNYRGPIIVGLRNHNKEEPVIIGRGERIAQIMFTGFALPRLELFEGSDEQWLNTDRGANGLGSTGK